MTPEPTTDDTAESPFIGIWDAPRETIRRIAARDPWRHVNALFFAAGVVGALDGFSQLADAVPVPPIAVPVFCAMTGLVAIPFGHLGAWYKRLVGRLLGGQARQRDVVAVAAWSSVPMIVGHAAICGIRVALYGGEVFRADHPTMDASSALLQRSLGLAAMLFSGWSLYVSVVGFAEVNRFSIGRSVATTILTPLLIVAAFIAILVGVIAFRAGRY
jgi:Yip1 domain